MTPLQQTPHLCKHFPPSRFNVFCPKLLFTLRGWIIQVDDLSTSDAKPDMLHLKARHVNRKADWRSAFSPEGEQPFVHCLPLSLPQQHLQACADKPEKELFILEPQNLISSPSQKIRTGTWQLALHLWGGSSLGSTVGPVGRDRWERCTHTCVHRWVQ